MRHKFKVGRVYHIKFLDHVKDDVLPVLCNVFGICVREDADSVVIAYWEVEHEDSDVVSNNREVLSLVKSTIKSRKLLD
jgi:hypothetical protein